MKQQLKKAASLLGALCLFNGMITGCSPAADSSDSSVNQMSELLLTDNSGQADAPETETVQNTTGTADSENLRRQLRQHPEETRTFYRLMLPQLSTQI